MKKIIPKYSKSEVNKAGSILTRFPRDNSIDINQLPWAFSVLSNWRASHDYPLNTFQANLRTKIKNNNFKNAIVVQRLKRTPSITGKLERYPKMKLSTMQDIGGLRAILNTKEQVRLLTNVYKTTKFDHELVSEYDYITNPKSSGYRSIHLVYRYKNRRVPEFDGLRIEIQLRSKQQHAWATAVETMGLFLDHALKSSEGPELWLECFALAGSAFAYVEKTPILAKHQNMPIEEIIQELMKSEADLDLINRLSAFGSTIKHFEKQSKTFKYYLLRLKPKAGIVIFEGYHSTELEKATNNYLKYERQLEDQKEEQIVLVSGDSFKALRKAYPNYFLDTHEFIKILRKIFSNVSLNRAKHLERSEYQGRT